MNNTKNVTTVLRALEALSSELGAAAPLSYAHVLLLVAAAGDAGIDQGSVVRQLNTSPSAGGRAVQALSKLSWLKGGEGMKKSGLDLIHSEQNAQNFRLRTLTLTAAGKRLVEKIGR